MSAFDSLRAVSVAVLPMPFVLGAIVWFVHGDSGAQVHGTSVLVLAAVAITAISALGFLGYRSAPLRQGVPTRVAIERGTKAFVSSAYLRMALSELPMMAGLALAFVFTEGAVVTYAVGGLITLALLAMHFVPNATQVGRFQESLEREGARVPLADAFREHRGQPAI